MQAITQRIETFPTQLSATLERYVVRPASENFTFFKHYLFQPGVVGSVIPSSSFAADAAVKQLKEPTEQSRRILEIGAGTGVFTKAILREMKDHDHLDIVEYVPELANMLQGIVDASGRHHQVTVHAVSIEDFRPHPQKYTHVISALPLTYFSSEMVERYFSKLNEELLAPNGKYSCLEYPVLPKIRLLGQKAFAVIDPAPLKNLSAILHAKGAFLKNHHHHADIVLRNIPPARIVHTTGQKGFDALNLPFGDGDQQEEL